ncbi:helix-turn-helix domain-containing protein [Streptomyces sp. NPDC057287]|uniref:helix-turn-helix domain-containing protein n=1 Tax=Streptomyces sp. NPDC057287 TaxID=3346086 RepID=UPI00363AC820
MGTEIQDFAELLRGLKERSGLSYGALAQKLHMSTSTVHRYCNGDAVPHDYAPVERFARVCRASADELMALHRKWILADEAKRRGTRKPEADGAAGDSGAPATAPGALADPAPAAPALPSPPGAGPAVPVPAASEAEAPDGAEPEAESEHGLEAESLSEDVTPEGPRRGAAAPRRTPRRLRVLLTAVAVVALTVPAALVVRGLGNDAPADDKQSDAAFSDAPVGPSGRASGSGSGKPSSSGSPSATPGTSTSSPSGARGGPATPPAPSREPRSDGVPVHATISSYNWESPCGQYYLLDQEPDDVPPPPPPQDTRGWARALGGVDGGDMMLELTVQGTSGEAVVLNGLHVRVLGRDAALARSAYSMGNGCGSGITPRSFDIDLDDSRPRSKPVAGTEGDTVVPAKDFPYRVSSTDVEVFNLDAHVEGHDVTWYLELEWTSGGRSGVLRIDDGGKPFRTSSLTARPSYYYRSDTAQWVPEEWGPEDQ